VKREKRDGPRGLTPREAAAQVVARVLDDGAFVAAALDEALKHYGSGWQPRDRALCTELAYGAVRWAAPLEAALLRGADKPGRGLDKRARPHLLVGAYQLQHLSERIPPHAAVNEAVSGVRRERPGLAGFANALLRHLGSPLHEQLKADASIEELAEAYGLTPLIVESTVHGLVPEERKAALRALAERPSLGVRWLGPDDDEGAWVAQLRERAEVRPHDFVPHAWLLDGAGAPTRLPGWEGGRLHVQDPGSQLCALLCAATPGQRVIDLCAAPGGKAVVLARAVAPDGSVVAVDRNAKRLRDVEENLARMGVAQGARVVAADARELDDEIAPPGSFDVVLLDAPCSALGTIRRHPEIRTRREPADVERVAGIQRELLDAAARLVAPGGALVYAVCTTTAVEGEDQVRALLAREPGLSTVSAREVLPWLPDDALTEEGWVRLYTHRHGTDAFFAARLCRDPGRG
jgi:16S rRNA (cytosine967-C5)-methyltransferase